MHEYDDLTTAPEELLWSQLGDAEGLIRADLLVELGRRAAERNESSAAIALFDEAATVAEAVDDLRLAAHALNQQGRLHFLSGDYPQSAQAYLRAAEQSRAIGRVGDQAGSLWGRADALRANEDFVEAVSTAEACRSLAESEELPQLAGQACYLLAKALYFLDRDAAALDACAAGRDYFRSVGATADLALIDDFALTIRLYLGDLDEALGLARNCHVLALATPSAHDDAYAIRRLADVHLRRGELDAARDRANEARGRYRDTDSLLGVARCDVIRARVLRSQGAGEEALEAFTEASVLFDSTGADGEAADCDTSRAVLLHSLGRFDEAAVINRRLIDALADQPNPLSTGMPWAVGRLADNLVAGGDAAGAVEVISQRLSLWDVDDGQERHSHRFALEVGAVALADVGRLEDAAALAAAALELTSEPDIDYRTAQMYELRSRWLMETQDQDASQAMTVAIALHLEVGSDETARELASLLLPEVRRQHADVALSEHELAGARG